MSTKTVSGVYILSINPRADAEAEKSLTIVNMMKTRLGVKLLAFDFDLTLLDIDTGGNKQTPEELARTHLRPCFRAIIAAGFKVGLQMCVVSYNYRKDLIAGVLKSAFPNCNTDDTIPVAVFPQSSQYADFTNVILRWGKEKQIAEILKHLKKQSNLKVGPHEIFLFDDVKQNIQHAVENDHLTYKVENDVTLDKIYRHVTQLCSSHEHELTAQCVDKVHDGPSNGMENCSCSREEGRTLTHRGGGVGALVSRVIVRQNHMPGWKEEGVWRTKSSIVTANNTGQKTQLGISLL